MARGQRERHHRYRSPIDRDHPADGAADEDGDDAVDAVDEDEGRPFGAPLPPDDRLWRHPSEVGQAQAPAPVAAGDVGATALARGRRPLAMAVCGLAGAVLTLGLVAAYANLGPEVVERQVVERVPVTPVSFESYLGEQRSGGGGGATVAADLGAALVRLEVRSGSSSATVGSGVVFRDDGHVLTNAHLVAGARQITARLHDGREVQATVVGADDSSDIAVLKLAGERFPTAVLGSADELRVGESAMAVGTPFGGDGEPAVTVGSIAALGRRVEARAGALHDMIETDAAIDRDASGGALVDRFGVVVGITTTEGTSGGGGGGGGAAGAAPLGLAVPIDLARAVADDLVETGHVRRVWLGIEGADVDPERAAALGAARGALVGTVVDDSPAAEAGLARGDVIVAVEDRPIATMSSLVSVLRRHDPGDTVELDYVRQGRPATCEVRLAALSPPR